MPKGSDLLVAALENEGVDRIFGVPGEENLDVVESLRNSSIKLILTRHEQGAAFMAATYGRLTGKPGVCITTLGPGALNLTTAAAYALLGAMPMIMLTGQKGIMSSRQAKFQIVDVVSAFKPLTKLSLPDRQHQQHPDLVRDAFRIAMEERPGPVLLELPEDVAGEEAEDVAMVAATSDRNSGRTPRRARSCRRDDPESQAAIDHARRRRVASAQHGRNRRLRPPHENSILHDPDGQRNRSRRQQSVYGHGRTQRA